MPIAQDVKNLAGDIIASYDARIAAVGNIVSETGNLLKRFDREHKNMSQDLRRNLAKGEDDRLKEFRAMLNGIQKRVKEIESETGRLLKQFQKELKDMSAALKEMLAASEDTRLKDFKVMLTGIQKRIKEMEGEVKRYLADVSKDMSEASEAWQEMAAAMAKTRHGVAVKIGKGMLGAEVSVKPVAQAVKKAAKPKKKGKKRKIKK